MTSSSSSTRPAVSTGSRQLPPPRSVATNASHSAPSRCRRCSPGPSWVAAASLISRAGRLKLLASGGALRCLHGGRGG